MSKETHSNTRVEPAAPKVAPAAREAKSPGSADPTIVSVCAVDAENVEDDGAEGTAKSEDLSHGCTAAVLEPLPDCPLRRTGSLSSALRPPPVSAARINAS
jgi:hypothetical protein